MIIKCDSTWEKEIFEYIGNDYAKCLYIYMDIKKYGFTHKDINIWINADESKKIQAIIFTYHNGMHIYSHDLGADWNEITCLILQRNPSIICAVSPIIEQISPKLSFKYNIEYGVIKRLSQSCQSTSNRIKKATINDIDEMAEMLYKNSHDGYSLEERKKQLNERLTDNYSRSYVIYENMKVVAQASTNAEIDTIAIIAGVKVDDNYRRKGLATELINHLCDELAEEGKAIYLVCYNEIANAMYDKMGFETCEQWGKLFLNS